MTLRNYEPKLSFVLANRFYLFEGLVRMVSLCWRTLVFMYPGCSLKLLFGVAFFFKYITDLPAYVIYNVIYGDDTTLDFKWDRLLICGNSLSQLLNVNLTYESLCFGIGSCLLTSMLGKLNLFYRSSNSSAVDVKTDGCVLDKKSYFKMLGSVRCFSSNL